MTKVLSQRIKNLSPESQVEVLQYVESLLKRRSKPVNDVPQRMTLDRFQERNRLDAKDAHLQSEAVHYTIW
jgi:hypothetical protein